jgi:hypothetical protein
MQAIHLNSLIIATSPLNNTNFKMINLTHLIGTLLDIPGKIIGTLKAWMDLEEMKLRKDLHHKTLENGSKNFQ